METQPILIALDYDGVLVDSYRGLPVFYLKDLPELTGISREEAEFLLYMEYVGESIGLLRDDWWFRYIQGLDEEKYDVLITRYWERRIEKSIVLPGALDFLREARRKSFILAHVGYRDDIYGLKKWRIEADGLSHYFDEIIIVGEDVSTRYQGLKILIEKYNPGRIIYVDDKAQNLYILRKMLGRKIELYKASFKSIWDFPWTNPGHLFTEINNLSELLRILGDRY
ncbi:hypothetical protein ACSU1N_05145 [Thermogladius sp. 4427co]|uniref:hypothetical protein n=1 Tax=Thermogladius sp. 4427co TaxID=3450718 RepID=UPI003F7ABECE